MSATIAITGASSFAARPLLHALLRREPRRVVLYDPLDGLAELQAQLLPWCEQQGIRTELQWWSQVTSAALQDLHGIQWLIHGDTVRAEALVAQWAASHPSCSVQVWRLPAAFDPQAITTAEASEPSAAWLRERLAEAFVDQLLGSGSAAGCQRMLAAASPLRADQPLRRCQALADAVVWPAQPIQAWLASLAEPLARYDNAVVLEALRGLWT